MGLKLHPPCCSMSSEFRSNHRYTTVARHFFKLQNFSNSGKPIEKLVSSQASMKFWNVDLEAGFPPVIVRIMLVLELAIVVMIVETCSLTFSKGIDFLFIVVSSETLRMLLCLQKSCSYFSHRLMNRIL